MVLVILVSLMPLLVLAVVIAAMFYWHRVYRHRLLNQEWESSNKKRKPKAGGLDCSDACAIMMDDDGSDSSSTHANNLNHNTELLPIELDLLVFYLCFICVIMGHQKVIATVLTITLLIFLCFCPRWGKAALLKFTKGS